MNVFILSTGRCGSTTFERACRKISNYTTGHETRIALVGPGRLDYPENHIESDNRLAWFLGRLDEAFGDGAFYVHLYRDREAVAKSYARRWDYPGSVVRAWYHNVHMIDDRPWVRVDERTRLEACRDYWETVNRNISAFLGGRPRAMSIDIAGAKEAFAGFWEAIGAQGDRDAALAEWDTRHNAGRERSEVLRAKLAEGRLAGKLARAVVRFPEYLRKV